MISATCVRNDCLNRLAGGRMERGIALLEGSDPADVHAALGYFDEAIELRRRLPLGENPGFRYGLAAGWINRGDALTRLGGPANLADAVNSYSAAIDLLKTPPAHDDGSFARRLSIAWMNRGIALEQQAALEEAIHSYKAAIELPGYPHRAGVGDLVIASAWVNLGNATLRWGGRRLAAEACNAAEQALRLLEESEAKELAAAEAGLKARHVLCQAVAALADGTSRDASVELINKMTDAVEGALSLVRNWENVPRFRPLAAQFFRLGALVYQKHQSHFLAEFLLDHFEPEWLAIAEESLARARRELRNCDFGSLSTARGIRQLETLQEIRAAEERLRMPRGHEGC